MASRRLTGVSPSLSWRNNRKDSQNRGEDTRLQVEDVKEEEMKVRPPSREGPCSQVRAWPGTLLGHLQAQGLSLKTTKGGSFTHSLIHQIIIESPLPRTMPGARIRH